MSNPIIDELYNAIILDLDTIRIEQTSINNPNESFKVLKLLYEIQENINNRFNETRGKV